MEAYGPGGGPLSVDAGDDRGTSLVGRLFDDRYRLDSVIARGGMATVFASTDTRLDRQVAVKVMHRALAEDPEFVARFTREAKASARLSAAEVVAVHDYGTDRTTGLAYLVMEHVRGINLRQLLLDRGVLTPARAVAIMEPVLRALAAAHAAGLVHRDIKPENVLVADDGRVKVADFGLARAVETSNLTQTTGLLMGTVAYLSPEQVETGTADARSDVYAAGVLLWELLTGTPPYSAESPLSVAYKHVHEDMPAPSTAMSGIPAALDAVVVRATRRDPAARPADGGAFLTELRAASVGLPSIAAATEHQTLVVQRPGTPQPPPPPQRRRRRRWLVPLIVLLVLSLIPLGGYYLGSYRYTKAPAVVGSSFDQAVNLLQDKGLKAKKAAEAFSDAPVGRVLSQSPATGAKIRKGGTVALTVSRGPEQHAVPALAGKTPAEAASLLTRARLKEAPKLEREYSQTIPSGQVTRSDPAAGTMLKVGSSVTVFVSRGTPPIEVPKVVGKKQADAVELLRVAGFEVSVTQVFSDTVEKGLVAAQSPAGGGVAQRGTTVGISVSKGPDVVVVPRLTGKTKDDAVAILKRLGLKAEIVDYHGPFNRVISTSPGGGSKVKRGSTVKLAIY